MPAKMPCAHVGYAGWSIPRQYAEHFPEQGAHLERYAQRLTAVEINSSFYRPHRPATYARWAAVVPEAFKFAVKVPKEITHTRRLRDVAVPLEALSVRDHGARYKARPAAGAATAQLTL